MARQRVWLVFTGLLIASGLFVWLKKPTPTHSLTVSDSDSLQVTARVEGPAPTTPAIIESPLTGTQVKVTPLVVRGSCGAGLIVRVYDDGVLVGTTDCALDNTFSVNITLHDGSNTLTVLNYDTIDQPGPDSAAVIVTVTKPIQPKLDSTHPTVNPPRRRVRQNIPFPHLNLPNPNQSPSLQNPPNPLKLSLPQFKNPTLKTCLHLSCWLIFFELTLWICAQLLGFLVVLVALFKRRKHTVATHDAEHRWD